MFGERFVLNPQHGPAAKYHQCGASVQNGPIIRHLPLQQVSVKGVDQRVFAVINVYYAWTTIVLIDMIFIGPCFPHWYCRELL